MFLYTCARLQKFWLSSGVPLLRVGLRLILMGWRRAIPGQLHVARFSEIIKASSLVVIVCLLVIKQLIFLEIMAIILAVEFAFSIGWLNLWKVISFWPFSSYSKTCLNLHGNCIIGGLIADTLANYVADTLANLDLGCDMSQWWSTFLNWSGRFLSNDANGLSCYRFS